MQPNLYFEIEFNGVVVRKGEVEFRIENNVQIIEVHLDDLDETFTVTGGFIELPAMEVPPETQVQFKSVCEASRPTAAPPSPIGVNPPLSQKRSLTFNHALVFSPPE